MHKADNLPPYRAVVMKSGSLNFLEPSGPARACYGRTLLFLHVLLCLKFISSFQTMDLIVGAECGVTTLLATPRDSITIHYEQKMHCTTHH